MAQEAVVHKKPFRVSRIFLYLGCILVAFIMLVPFVWMVSASFKNNVEIFQTPIRWIPEVFRWENYEYVWTEINFPTYFFNTAKLAVIITVLQLITCSMAAFAFTKLKFPGRDKLFLCYLAT